MQMEAKKESFPIVDGRILHPLGEPNIPAITEDAFRGLVSIRVEVQEICENRLPKHWSVIMNLWRLSYRKEYPNLRHIIRN